MNASNVLKYGHEWFLKTLDGMPETAWDQPGATGSWSPKDILSHITSYELILIPILKEYIDSGRSEVNPIADHEMFNDQETSKRKDQSFQAVLDEYNEGHETVMNLMLKILPEKFREDGTLPWYGSEYSLDDYLVYSFYGHKREHGAQISAFKDRL